MREDGPELERLRDAIAELAADAAPAVVAEARADATARVRSMLSDAIAHELLDRAQELMRPDRADTPKRRAEPKPARRTAAEPETFPRPAPGPPSDPAPVVEPSRAPAPHVEGTDGTGCYVYGVIASESAKLGEGLPGVDAHGTTRTIHHGGLAAIASDVPLGEFGEEPLLDNLNDVAWLEATARAHEEVLDAVRRHSTVVPLRICTIYVDEEHVETMLETERGPLTEALNRLAGKTEWGVKLIARPGALEDAVDEEDDDGEEGQSAGAAYIAGRRREARLNERLEAIATEWAAAAHEALEPIAAEALRNPLQTPELAGYDGEMLLNGVYLVEDDDDERFGAAVDALVEQWEPRGVTVELTGPWPPYNFVKSSIEAAR